LHWGEILKNKECCRCYKFWKFAKIPCTAWRLGVCRLAPTQRQWVCVVAKYGVV